MTVCVIKRQGFITKKVSVSDNKQKLNNGGGGGSGVEGLASKLAALNSNEERCYWPIK